MPNKTPKFSSVTDVATPGLATDETYTTEDQERDYGEAILRNWTLVARWNWSDQHVADMLEKAAHTLRDRASI